MDVSIGAGLMLPAGVVGGPLTAADVDVVVTMVNRCELADSGMTMWDTGDLRADIGVPGFDPAADWVGIRQSGELIAWGLLTDPHRAWIDVVPEHRDRGIGSWLLDWSQRRATAMGAAEVGQSIEESCTDAVALLRRAGYTERHTSWVLHHRGDTGPVVPPEAPPGLSIRPIADAAEADAALLLIEEAFSGFAGRHPVTLPTWRALVLDREGFSPADLPVALLDGRIVGSAVLIDAVGSQPDDAEVWVDKLAVAEPYRHRGIARALLAVAFDRAQVAGHGRTALSTDSRTGALDLYLRVGMTVTQSYTRYALALPTGP